ncbi:General transcription factor 3C polypeptide 3 [Orchesella cincta]|uniref:General transcription factor 3C polypeptide 3 n=1 Tax=Orchesella cincta TaxID=48709 RepID=A0A1D2MP51_ORCCI|nr:General transcription factor 3C polypeptide 3 [Orchesella cincta]
MDDDEGGGKNRRGKTTRFPSTPVFVNTEDLVNMSLGLHPPEGGGDESTVSGEVFHDEGEMDVDYADEESVETVPVHDHLQAATQGLSNYYNVSEEDERIRNVTNEYLEGRLSLLEFAAAMEHYGKLGTEVDTEEEEVTSVGTKKPIPSLVLLTPETAEYGYQPQPGTSQQLMSEAESVKLRGEFFRSGDQLATFTVRKRRKMPPTIKNLMGEAHVRFARGDLSGAETICMEVIKEQPTYKDPFHTLAMIYENQGNRSKSLQFYLICALLDPKRFDDWPRLAEMSVEEENTQQAIMCLNKAVSVEPANVKLHLRRCQLLKDTGDHKGALKGYQKVHQLTTDGKIRMDVAKDIAHSYFQMQEIDKAYEILIDTFRTYSEHVTHYELNLLAEVCITVKKYLEVLQMFIKHGCLQFTPCIQDTDFENRDALTKALSASNKRDCVLQSGLHSDLIQKIVIVLIHLEAFKFAEQIVNRLLAVEDINNFGLQLFEIAEAYIAKKENRAALRLLNPLINSDNYSEAEVWLRYAECLYMINKYEDAAAAYEKVISLAPNHKIAKLNLSIILQRLGKYDGALESLDQNDMEELIDHDLLLERCKIFLNRGRLSELYDTALQLFSRHCPQLRNFEETQVLIVTSHTQQQLEGLKALRLRKQEPITDMSVDLRTSRWKILLKNGRCTFRC